MMVRSIGLISNTNTNLNLLYFPTYSKPSIFLCVLERKGMLYLEAVVSGKVLEQVNYVPINIFFPI